MNTEDIGRVLRELPRIEASPGFTRRVMVELERPARGFGYGGGRSPITGRLALAAAAIAFVGLLGFGAIRVEQAHARRNAATEIARMRDEQRMLARELAHLRQQSDALQPVVYVGGNDRVDFVLDVRKLGVTRVKGPRP